MLTVIECMASPNGTTIDELVKSLSIKRRSVFRLIRILERELHIQFDVSKKSFGGTVAYRLPPSFLETLSDINTRPQALSFRQSVLFYLLFDESLQRK